MRQFAAAKGIGFPLLADEGSHVITALGLLDRDLAQHHAGFGMPTQDHQLGVAYPAIFVLDESGRVADKRIRHHYRAREGALALLEGAFDLRLPPAGPAKESKGDHVRVTMVTDSASYVRWQETRLHVIFDIDAGWQVYGRPVPAGYSPATVEVESLPEVAVGPPEYPPTRRSRVEGLDEEFHVHEGRFDILVPFAVNVPAGQGRVVLRLAVGYQACNESECLPPRDVKLELGLDEAPPE